MSALFHSSPRRRVAPLLALLLASAGSAPAALAQHERAVARALDDYWVRRAYAVQPRAFSKGRALELGLYGGVVPTDPLRTYLLPGARAVYHLTERWGVGADFDYWLAVDGALADELTAAGAKLASFERERPRWRAGGLVQWTPLYGKLSAYGRIVHVDLHLIAGAGALYTRAAAAIGAAAGPRLELNLGAGLGLLLGRRWMLTLDYRQHVYLRPSRASGPGGDVAWPAAFHLGAGVLLGGRR